MSKRLIVYCDGTWNRADQTTKDGKPCPTNILKLFELTLSEGKDGVAQIALYLAGVGTRMGERLTGGGFGYGISDNVKTAYAFIVSNYEPGDGIYLFGFSRGAFTARSIAGLIRNMGILRRDRLHLANEAYEHYRDQDPKWTPESDLSKTFRAANAHPVCDIHFLGVFDTVGALGAPFGSVLSKITDALFNTQFHDVKLSSIVLSAYHALAIDERRWPFRPTLWELNETHRARIAESKQKGEQSPYEEKWFPGVHSNVGGGYEKTGLSDCALEWMVEKARGRGLDIASEQNWPFQPKLKEAPENSQTFFYRAATLLFEKLPRLISRKAPESSDAALVKYVNRAGDYVRPISDQGDVVGAVAAHPEHHDYDGALSFCAIGKLAEDKSYRPVNVDFSGVNPPDIRILQNTNPETAPPQRVEERV